jgi:2-dehydro-3-deoxyphosphooctonate aldolase (KDO 8-P synthase)
LFSNRLTEKITAPRRLFYGIGDRKALEILQRIKETYKIRVITDIHLPEEAFLAATYHIDILQIPAFLCRQTSLLKAAAKTGKCVNVKKGQFLAPGQMQFVVDKLLQFGCDRSKIFLTERGTQFGYSDLIFDVRGIPEMQSFGVPVILDVTHSLQQPNKSKGVAGGRPGMITTLATAGVSIGVDGLFIETHPRPEEALSDGANMLPLNKMKHSSGIFCHSENSIKNQYKNDINTRIQQTIRESTRIDF